MGNVPLPFPYSIFFRHARPQSECLWGWLPRMDSNHDKQIQNLQCYRYTTRQIIPLKINRLYFHLTILISLNAPIE